MPTTLTSLFNQLKDLELSPETRKAHTSVLNTLVHELTLSNEQLEAVGNDPLKLTVQYQARWDQDRASLAGLPSKAVELAKKHGRDLLAMHYCDKLTLLYSKEHYGRLLDLLVGTQDCAVYWASADLDNFKLINDGWSHAHGDFAIIQTGLAIGEAVAAWNRKHEGVAQCLAFRMGGDEFVFAVLVPASQRGSFDGEVKALFDDVYERVKTVLGQQFDFTSLDDEKRKVRGKNVTADGPTISICASDCVLTESLEDETGKARLNMAYERADALLKEKKDEGKKAAKEGGVHLLSEQVVKQLSEVPTLVAQLQSGSADAKAEAAAALMNLAVNDDNEVAIAKEEGALAALVALVRDGSAVGKEKAAAALQNLAVNADNKVAIAKEEGALAALVALLREGSAVGKEHAAGALMGLAVNADNNVSIAKEEGALAALVALLREGSAVGKENAAGALRNLAANADNKVAIAKEEGALAALVALLREGSAVGKEKAAGALRNLAANADNKVAIAKEEGALAALVALVRDGSAVGKEKAAGALQNLAVNADNKVAIAKEEGALAVLVALVRDGSAVGKEKAAGALMILAVNNADNQVAIANEEGALAALVALLREGSAAGKKTAAGAVKSLSRNTGVKSSLLQLGCPANALA